MSSSYLWMILFIYHAFLSVYAEVWDVLVMEGGSLTLLNDVPELILSQQNRHMWYFNDKRIADITGNQSKICSDVQCKKRFKDRLKVDQTGSLTITNIPDTDSGEYRHLIRGSSTEDRFNVSVQGAPDEQRKKRHLVKKGESVALDPGELKNTNDVMTWSFNDTLIAEVTGDQRKICEDARCKERFRDRLELDHQTGSLIITNTRNTDSGEYTLKITSNRERYSTSSIRIFSVSVVLESGLSSAAVAGICAAALLIVLLLAAAARWIYRWSSRKETQSGSQPRAAANGGPLLSSKPLEESEAV